LPQVSDYSPLLELRRLKKLSGLSKAQLPKELAKLL